MNLEDKRPDPSIYVGETCRSLAERSAEHQKDGKEEVSNQEEESHMRKHWQNTHRDDKGPPKF